MEQEAQLLMRNAGAAMAAELAEVTDNLGNLAGSTYTQGCMLQSHLALAWFAELRTILTVLYPLDQQ